MNTKKLNGFNVGTVSLLPGLFKERADINKSYLMELNSQCLLQNFYLEAGIIMPGLQVVESPETALLHWGWEAPTCQLRGHFLGHWMSAAAVLCADGKDARLKAKLDYIVDELEKCQKLNGGKWIGSIPEKYFKKLETGDYIWSPQYVMHKTLLGLMHTYEYTGSEKALKILDGISDWYVDWIKGLKERGSYAVYKGEEGGMLEVWANLYALTENEKYLSLAKEYDHPGNFDQLLDGQDILTNCHSNASIPWAHGAARLYEITGEERWLNIVKAFWKCAVKDRDLYCTGGQNAGEFWIPPRMNGHFMGERNQEFCTVYNMVRLADYLYRFTGEAQYADFIEQNLYNGFLAQQNKHTGLPTYFLPLSAGSRKKWGSKTRDFWCCHGTMVQSQTLYPSLCYYTDNDNKRLVAAQYIPSSLKWTDNEGTIEISQTTDMKYYNSQAFFDEKDESTMSRWLLKFEIKGCKHFTFSLRMPEWLSGNPVLSINGEEISDYIISDGYLDLERDWDNDMICIYLPASLSLSRLSDMPELAAVKEGPIVLAELSEEDCGLEIHESLENTFMPQLEHTYDVFPWLQSCYRTRFQKKNTRYVPLYDITDESYTVYHTLT